MSSLEEFNAICKLLGFKQEWVEISDKCYCYLTIKLKSFDADVLISSDTCACYEHVDRVLCETREEVASQLIRRIGRADKIAACYDYPDKRIVPDFEWKELSIPNFESLEELKLKLAIAGKH